MIRSLRTITTISRVSLMRTLSDTPATLFLFGVPLLIIGIIGITVFGAPQLSNSRGHPIRVMVAGTASPIQDELLDLLEEQGGTFEVQANFDEEMGRQEVLPKKSDVLIVIPHDFPIDPIRIVTGDGVQTSYLVENVVRLAHARVLMRSHVPVKGSVAVETTVVDSDSSQNQDTLPATSISLFAVTMVSAFVLWAAQRSLYYYVYDHRTGTYQRTIAFGVSEAVYGFGTFASSMLLSAAYMGAMIIATSVLYSINWGEPLAWSTLSIVGAFGAAAAQYLLMVVPNPENMQTLSHLLITVMALLGSPIIPKHLLPGWAVSVSDWFPNKLIQEGFIRLAYGGGLGDIMNEMVRLIGTGCLLLLFGWAVVTVRAGRG